MTNNENIKIVNEQEVMTKDAESKCVLCGGEHQLTMVKGAWVCKNCIADIVQSA